jgi:cytochrome c-type biogenesis protein CcmH/NrfF
MCHLLLHPAAEGTLTVVHVLVSTALAGLVQVRPVQQQQQYVRQQQQLKCGICTLGSCW